MPNLSTRVNRDQLAQALNGNYSVIRAFEQLISDTAQAPASAEEANVLAGSALALAQSAVTALSVITEVLSQIESAPALPPYVEPDDMTVRPHVGTLGQQNHDSVEITGGTASLSALTLSGQLKSTVAIGTPPLSVVSTDKVVNLYADRAARADSLGTASTYPAPATDLPTVIALANALRTAAINKGL